MESNSQIMQYKKSPFVMRLIAAVLVISFLAYDISWAYPERFTPASPSVDTVAPPSFFDQKTSVDLVRGKIIEHYIEYNGIIARHALTLDLAKRLLAQHVSEDWFT